MLLAFLLTVFGVLMCIGAVCVLSASMLSSQKSAEERRLYGEEIG